MITISNKHLLILQTPKALTMSFNLQSVVAKGLLTDISEKANYVSIMMNFSAQTSSQRTQEMIEVKLEKKRKNILGLYRCIQLNFVFRSGLNYLSLAQYSYARN